MTEQQIVPLLVQAPLLAIFVWFTLRLSADFRADTAKRDAQWQTFIEQQNEQWRGFIRELVERSSSADDVVSQRLAELAEITRSLVQDLKAHDAESRRRNTGR